MSRLLFTVLSIAISLGPLQTAPGGNGRISGIVIQAGTDRPIDGVQIFFTPVNSTTSTPVAPPQNPLGTFTDQFGRFEIGNLAPGRYRIEWTRPGYFTPPVGTPGPDESIIQSLIRQLGTDDLAIASPPAATSVTVDLAPQEKLGGFVFALIPGGVISGRVLDPMGNPLVSAPLMALRLSYEDGRLVLRPGGNFSNSDDRGNFRLFGLRPGEYYVRVESPRFSADSNEIVRAYFPGVTGVSTAIPIVVNENGESPGANFNVPDSGTVKISGTIIGPGNMQRSIAQFYLLPVGTDQLEDPSTISIPNSAAAANRAAGEFELRRVSSGQYNLTAFLYDNVQMRSYTGHVSLDVGAQDFQNVSIEMRPAGDLKGRLVLEDGSPVRRTINLRPRETKATVGRTPPPVINANTDGTFVISQIPEARYSVTQNATDSCITDIHQGGKSVYDAGFVGGADAAPIDVVLSTQCGTVQVQVVDDKKQPVLNAFVSLVPAMDHRRNPQLYKRSIFDVAASKYPPINLIPPGEYKLFAWDNIPPNAELNAQFLAKFEDRGVSVTVRRGDSLTVQLPLISTKN